MANFRTHLTSCWAAIFIVIVTLLNVADASATSGIVRSATLIEPTGSSQHVYREEENPANRNSDNHKRTILHHQPMLWLYDVAISFNQDYDGDGYHSNFSITFDFDSHHDARLVYAVLYVSSGTGPWVEYAVTSNFTIDGSTSRDAYTIYADLDSGYRTGYYDHLIEIYDAHSNTFLAEFGPADSHVLHNLPIESIPLDHRSGISTAVAVQFSGVGASEPTVPVLLLSAWALYWRRRQLTIHGQ